MNNSLGLGIWILLMGGVFALPAKASSELDSEIYQLCQNTDANSNAVTSTGCYQYIQGFLQGALITDDAIIKNIESSQFESRFANRAYRTRVGNTRDSIPATQYAGFCLPNNEIIHEVVINLLLDMQKSLHNHQEVEIVLPALLFKLLKQRYICGEE